MSVKSTPISHAAFTPRIFPIFSAFSRESETALLQNYADRMRSNRVDVIVTGIYLVDENLKKKVNNKILTTLFIFLSRHSCVSNIHSAKIPINYFAKISLKQN